jgi:deoxyribodipyrimidine photo-lyase
MASPVTGWQACSRLSPHLAFGTLSAREVEQAAAMRAAQVRGQRDWGAAVKSFRAR